MRSRNNKIMARRIWPAALGALLAVPTLAHTEPREEFRQDFRGARFPQLVLRLVGRKPSQYVRPTNEGLRVALPAEKGSFPQTGISPSFKVAGDFELTVGYKILKVDRPEAGYGSGVCIFVQTQSTNNEAATLGVFLTRSDSLKFLANRHTGPKDQRQHKTKAVRAEDDGRAGHLRLARSGSVLRYAVAPGQSKEFTQLREVELGNEPLAQLRIVADPGGGKGALEVLFTDLVVRADKLTTESAELERASAWGVWAIAGGVVAAAVAAGLFLWQRRRKAQVA